MSQPINLKVAARRLAFLVADRLNSLLPEGFQALSSGTKILVCREDELFTDYDIESLVDQGGEPEENIITGAHAALDHIQDALTEEFKKPWPFDPAGRIATLHAPRTKWVGNELRLSFGSEGLFLLPPIALDDLTQST